MITVQKAQKICLGLAVIAFVIGLCASLLANTGTESAGMLWPDTAHLWLVRRLEMNAFRFGAGAVGGYLVLEFIGRPWPYQLFVPLVGVGAVAGGAYGGPISSTYFGMLMLLLGPAGGIGTGWFARNGTIGLLIASALLVLSARAETRLWRVYMLFLFGLAWLAMGMVSAAISTFAGV